MSDISDANLSDAQVDAEHEPKETDTSERFGQTSHSRIWMVYAAAIVGSAIILNFLLRAGADLRSPEPEESGSPTGEEAIHVAEVFWKLLLASAVIIVAARVLGAAFRKIGQPQVMGEIVAGILLGPSLLGTVWPGAQEFLFSAEVLPFIEVLAELGLIFFMFLIGLELDLRLIKGRGHAAAAVSHASILIPFLLGAALALGIFTTLGSEEGDFVPFALFMGASMSITAFPVLARILTERGLNKTRLGAVTITCAAIDDVTAWCLLAVVVAVAAANGLGGAFVTIGLAVLFIVGMIVIVRPLVARIARHHEETGGISATVLAMVFAGLLLSALATDRIGIHAIFGAFLFGAIMPQQSDVIHELTSKLEDVAVLFLLPLFFAFSGLRTEIGQLGADPQLWAYCALIVGIAILGKWGGSAAAARFVGLSWKEAGALGILMNCRGLTELVILNIGLDLGVIPPVLFAMLVIMALVTTFMTTPILSMIYPREEQERMIREESGEAAEEDGVWRILVHVPSMEGAYQLVANALSLSRNVDQDVQVVLLRTLRYDDYGFRAGGARQAARLRKMTDSLRPLVDFVEGAGFSAVPLAVMSADPGETIARVAAERNPDLVLLSVNKPVFGGRLTGGILGTVLREAPSDVAVLVDPAGRGTNLKKGGKVLVPYGGGFHEDVGLDLALRLARAASGQVVLLGPGGDAHHALAETAAGAYEREGVWTTSQVAERDIVEEAVAAARDADLVVLGVSDSWADEPDSVGHLREVVAGATSTPLLVVRRHGQQRRRGPRRWFGRRGEWMEDATGEIDLREPEVAAQQ